MKPKNWLELPESLLTNLLQEVDFDLSYDDSKTEVIQAIVRRYSQDAEANYFRPVIQKYWDALTEEQFQAALTATREYHMQQLEQLEEY